MFIVVYPVFYYIVYCVYFEERSKMGLILSPILFFFPRGRCQAAEVFSQFSGQYVYDSCEENRVVDFWSR